MIDIDNVPPHLLDARWLDMTHVNFREFVRTNEELIAGARAAEESFRKLGDVLPDLAPQIRTMKRQRRKMLRKLRRLRTRHGQ